MSRITNDKPKWELIQPKDFVVYSNGCDEEKTLQGLLINHDNIVWFKSSYNKFELISIYRDFKLLETNSISEELEPEEYHSVDECFNKILDT